MAGPNLYELVTAKILAALEAGTVPWRKPWTGGGTLPRSLATGRPYRGINPFLLQMEATANSYTSPWWGTFDQIAERAGMTRTGKRWVAPEGDDQPRGVTKGQRGTLIVFWAKATKERTNPATGQVEETKLLILRYFKVFNLDQAAFPDGLPARYATPGDRPASFDPCAEAEAVAAGYFGPANDGPCLVHVDDTRAFYSPSSDVVNVPPPSCFTTAEGYYSTLFHEAGHSAGHPSRLARPGIIEGHRFGAEAYSQEELVADSTRPTGPGSIAATTAGPQAPAASTSPWPRPGAATPGPASGSQPPGTGPPATRRGSSWRAPAGSLRLAWSPWWPTSPPSRPPRPTSRRGGRHTAQREQPERHRAGGHR